MTNEEFQNVVLEEIRGMKQAIDNLAEGQDRLVDEQSRLVDEQRRLADEQSRMKQKLDAVYNQTAILTEFRTETITKLNNISDEFKSIYEILGEHEVAIRTLRRKPV